MRLLRFTDEHVVGVLKAAEVGTPMSELMGKHEISSPTINKWKAIVGGLEVSAARLLKAIEEDDAKLKPVLVDWMLNNVALKDPLGR
jgi:putative transposase